MTSSSTKVSFQCPWQHQGIAFLGAILWIDIGSVSTEYERNFLITVSKCLLMCQKVEMAYRAIVGFTEFVSNGSYDKDSLKKAFEKGVNRTIGQSRSYAEQSLKDSLIGVLSSYFPDIPKFRNYIAHDVLSQLSSIYSEPMLMRPEPNQIINKELKEIYSSVRSLIILDNALNCIMWTKNEHTNPLKLPVTWAYEKSMLKWIFDGFEEKDYLPDETTIA